MTREPFDAAIEDDLFYAEPMRKQRLDILLHLAQYGNELMLVTGPEGSGKTTLLQQFQNKALDTWSIARIDARDGIDERKLVQQLYHQMNMEFHGATHAELLENMEHHFDSLQRSARQGILLIDDADQLPVTAINQIVEMAALTNAANKPLLRIIMFGAPELENHFSAPQTRLPANLVRRTFDLPPFDGEHTAHYVLHRLSAAGFIDNEPFTESVLRKLHKQSGGWPGRINELAHNLLLDSLPTLATEKVDDKGITFKPLRVIAAVVASAIMGSILIWQDDINNWLKPGEITADTSNSSQVLEPAPPFIGQPGVEQPNAEQPEPALALAQGPSTPLEASTETTPPLPQQESTALKITATKPKAEPEPIKGSALASIDTAKDKHVPDTDTDKTSEPTPGETAATTPAEKPQPVDQKLPAQTTAKQSVSLASPPTPTPTETANDLQQLPAHQEDWLLGQNPNHYTLQLISGEHITTTQRFIRKHQLQADLALYRTIRRDKPWFVLLHGVYPSWQEAIDARGRLPEKLRLAPWVRNLADVQKDIHKTLPQ